VDFALVFLPVNILCLNQSNLLHYSFSPFFCSLYCSVAFSVFCVSCSYPDLMCFIIIHSLSFFSSFPPPLASSNGPTFGNMFSIYFYMFFISI
jgi:hypothetical protein